MTTGFNVIQLSQQIYERGIDVAYHQGYLCSCRKDKDGHPDPSCGCVNGFRYLDPVTYRLLWTKVDFKNLIRDQGLIYKGECTFTIPKVAVEPDEQRPGQYKITSSALPIYDRICRGDVLVITTRNQRGCDILQMGVRDEIGAFNVQEILLVSQTDTIFEADTDYVLNGEAVEWVDGGNAPDDKSFYSVEFMCRLQYVVWDDFPMYRGAEGENLPKRILCRHRFYVEQEVSGLRTLVL